MYTHECILVIVTEILASIPPGSSKTARTTRMQTPVEARRPINKSESQGLLLHFVAFYTRQQATGATITMRLRKLVIAYDDDVADPGLRRCSEAGPRCC